jgi:hypothetical protein
MALDQDYCILLCTFRGATYALPPLIRPTLDPIPILNKVSAVFHERNKPAVFRAIPANMLSYFPKDKYKITPEREIWDYLYRTKDLIELRGRKYQQKRNHINRFRQDYQFSYNSLTPEDVQGCIELYHQWAADKKNSPEIEEERLALKEALENFSALALKGGVIRVEGKIQAFAIGSRLNKNTALIHFEKANPEFSGIYAAINQFFVKNEWPNTKYINREDDMGIPGLRQSKKRYHPLCMIEKYLVVEDS